MTLPDRAAVLDATPPRAPVLVIGVGNPSRGDDALGPAFVEAVAAERERWPVAMELLTDFQLQIEHALDCEGRAMVVFVDAAADGPSPYALTPAAPDAVATHTTHAMSPGAVLEVAARACGGAPPAWVLAIRGETFELGAPISPPAREHLAAALAALRRRLDALDPHRPRRSALRSTGSNKSA